MSGYKDGWDFLNVVCPPGVKDALRAAAHERGMSLSAAIREGTQTFLKAGPAKHPRTGRPPHLSTREPDTDDAFGHWLAGFIDGEGCFMIVSVKGGRVYRAVFGLTCRLDDIQALKEIQRRTGFGKVYRHENRRSRSAANPIAEWAVSSKADVRGLIDLLDRYPLRAKKARDYTIWRKAATLWLAYSGNRWSPPGPWDEMAILKQELQEVRAYRHVAPT